MRGELKLLAASKRRLMTYNGRREHGKEIERFLKTMLERQSLTRFSESRDQSIVADGESTSLTARPPNRRAAASNGASEAPWMWLDSGSLGRTQGFNNSLVDLMSVVDHC
jgi:hypothetical protein